MNIVVTVTGARVEEVDTLTSFAVITSLPKVAVDLTLRHEGLGVIDGDHAWISLARLEALASPRATVPDWNNHFRAMVDFAVSKGWWDAVESRLRAHLQEPTS